MTPTATYSALNFYRRGLRGFSVLGKTVLDFGCGAVHPFDMSTVFWLNGAASCLAIDMRGLESERVAANTLADHIDEFRAAPDRWLIPGSSMGTFLQRLDGFDVNALRAGRLYGAIGSAALTHLIGRVQNAIAAPGSIDIVVSNTVIEHVADLGDVARHLRTLLSRDGVMYHIVDYTDHGIHGDPKLNYWSFMTEGHEVPDIAAGGDMNKLRNSEVEAIFREAGLIVSMDPLIRQTPPDSVLYNLLPKYQTMSPDDLELVTTGLRLTRT